MLEDYLVERFLDPNCSDEELDELRSWLSFKVCPKCLSEDIDIDFEQELDDEQYLVAETVNCQCCRPSCLNSVFITRNLD